MGMVTRIGGTPAMASPWRRRPLCVLVAGSATPAAMTDISGSGAFVETDARPAIGDIVELRHPEAGAIAGRVRAIAADGVSLDFDGSEAAVAFALAAITADMTVA